jgi:hypothetical protein
MSTTKTAIEYKEYGRLIGSRYSYFEITTDGVIHPPLFIDPMISAKDLSTLYVGSIANGNGGIRFYPGLTDDNRMVFIMCEVNAVDTTDETNYRIFDRFISGPEQPYLPSNPDQAQQKVCTSTIFPK